MQKKVKAEIKKEKAIYVRVSTDSQIEGYSIEAQIELVSAYLKSRECTDYKVYTDPGFSGKDLNRPAIKQLISDIIEGKIETVLVFKLDRLSRSQKDTLYMIEEVFNKYDVGFISIRESFDTTTPFGKAMIGILSVFAQLERETILERTRIGLKKRAEDGYWKGGGRVPYAYDYDKNKGMLVINPERKIIFDLLKSLRLGGASYPQMAEISGLDQSVIQGILNCKTNLGLITYKGEIYNGRHEAVITEEEFKQLQEVEKNRSKCRRAKHYLLSGMLYCGHCGAKFRYQKWGRRVICYCYSQQKSKPKLIKDPNCRNKRIDSFEIEDAFLQQLFEISLDESRFNETFDLASADVIKELTTRINKIKKQIDNLVLCLSEGIALDEIRGKINQLINEREDIESKLKEEKRKEGKNDKTFSKIKNLNHVWNKMDFKEKRTIVEELLDKIVIDGTELKIEWKIG